MKVSDAKEAAVKIKRDEIPFNPAWKKKERPVTTATVVAVEDDAGTRNITLRFPHNKKFKFRTADGIGIPAMPDPVILDRVLDHLSIKNGDERDIARQLLLPTPPYPNVFLSSPRRELLEIIAKKLGGDKGKQLQLNRKFTAAAQNIHRRGQTLSDILQDDEKLEHLQATYDVAEILELFPGVVTKEELIRAQGPSHGNKTFCLIDYGRMKDERNRECDFVTVSVVPEAGLHTHASFGEGGVERLHLGETSVALYNLRPGDEIKVTSKLKHKPDFQLPADKTAEIVMIGQGNGAASFTTFLMELEQRKSRGEVIPKASLMLAARDLDSVWGIKRFLPYLENGTLSQLDIAVSDTDPGLGMQKAPADFMPRQISDGARARISIHHGTRLVDDRQGVQNHHQAMLSPDNAERIGKLLRNGGHIYLAGGEPFHYSMTLGLAEIARREIQAMDDTQFKQAVRHADTPEAAKFYYDMRSASAPEPTHAEIFMEEFLGKGGDREFSGRAISAHSPARIKGIAQGWTRRVAGKALVKLCRGGKAPGYCPL